MFIAFQRQQWLGEHVSLLRYTYIDSPVGQVDVIIVDGISAEEKLICFCFVLFFFCKIHIYRV